MDFQLENDGKTIEARANRAKNEQKAQIVLRHITGIERWGQQRLQAFLGKAFVRDEFDGYQPATNLHATASGRIQQDTRKQSPLSAKLP